MRHCAGVPPPTLTIVVPVFNEQRRLPRLLDAVAATADADVEAAGMQLLEVLVVDDGSTDGTSSLAAAAGSPVEVLTLAAPNAGKGRALAAGIAASRGERTLLCDVDLSTPLRDVAPLAAAVDDGADLAIGSRAVDGAAASAPLVRRVSTVVFNTLVRASTGLDVGDTQRGFKLGRTEVLRKLCESRIVDGFAWDVELLVRASQLGCSVVEVPVHYDHDDDSRVRPANAARAAWDVLRVRRALGCAGTRGPEATGGTRPPSSP